MKFRFKFLPIAITSAIVLMTLKIGDVWRSADAVLGSSTAIASEHETSSKANAEASQDEETIEEPNSEKLVERLKTPDVIDVSPTEIRMLENLLERRTQLEKWENDLDMREKLLAATEARVDDKISELKATNANIEGLINQFNEREDKKITSLVKIYESMKPKDAARIFNNLELEILLEVLARMREAKAASIIAKMNSAKANIVTSELAVRRSLPGSGDDSANVVN